MNFILLIMYFLIILFIGYSSYKKITRSSDFFIADKKAGVFQVTGSLLATVLGSSAILGSVSFAYTSGWAGSWFMLCGSIGLLLLYPMLKYFKDFKGYNLPELLGSFYGSEVKNISSVIIAIAWVGIVAAQIIGASQIIGNFTDLTYENAVLISGFVFILYTILGGQISIIKTDCIQLIFILIGLLMCFIFSSTNAINLNAPSFINSKFGYKDLFIMILTYSSTFLVGPDIYSRLFCAKDEATMKKSILLSVAILIPLSLILASIGIYAANSFPELNIVNKSPLLHIAATSLPKPISTLLYFGLLSAVISSADTSLMTAASIFTQIFTKDLNKKESIPLTRVFILIFGIFSIIVSIKLKFILPTLLLSLTIYSGALIIPSISGLMGYRGNKKFTIMAIITGGVIAGLGKLYGGTHSNLITIISFILNSFILFFPQFIK